MCGIVGYTGPRPSIPILLQGLGALEYRGYDSAGVAVIDGAPAEILVTKREGKLARLEGALAGIPASGGTTGIGHTRWATHGAPNDQNAHPHQDEGGQVAIAHNGIVENYAALREELLRDGCTFSSDTDSEVIAHLFARQLAEAKNPLEALRAVCGRLTGSHAIVAMSLADSGSLVAAKIGNAGGVVIGFGEDEHFVASDLAAIIPHTRRVAFLMDGEFAALSSADVQIVDRDGRPVLPEIRDVPIDPMGALKGGHPHFMLKEILEQPQSLTDTVHSLVTVDPLAAVLPDLEGALPALDRVSRIVVIGMGTSFHAAAVGRSYFETLTGLPTEVDNASEFRNRVKVIPAETLVVSVSQSGETVDVLEAMAAAKAAGSTLVTICNIEGAQTTRVADGTVYMRAGLERSVASTKCFTSAIAALYALGLGLGSSLGVLNDGQLEESINDSLHLPALVARQLEQLEQLKALATRLADAPGMLFLGRGLGLPAAMEGALKMKEVSYIHAEAYAAGEMKHGPISLIEPSFPTVAIATRHGIRDKMLSNIQQVLARGGPLIAIATEGDKEIRALVEDVVEVPAVRAEFEPIVTAVPLQFLAYFVALERNCDVDQPRNLAKTVTVE